MPRSAYSAGGIRVVSGTNREREDTLARQQIERGDYFEDVGRACDRWLRCNSLRYVRHLEHKDAVIARRAARIAPANLS